MGSRSRNHDKGGTRRVKLAPSAKTRVPADHFAGQKAVYAHLKDYPDSNVHEIAEALNEPLTWTVAQVNALKNKGLINRGDGTLRAIDPFDEAEGAD